MTKSESIGYHLNARLAASRGDEIGKILNAVQNITCAETLRQAIQDIHNQFWKFECSLEEEARKQLDRERERLETQGHFDV